MAEIAFDDVEIKRFMLVAYSLVSVSDWYESINKSEIVSTLINSSSISRLAILNLSFNSLCVWLISVFLINTKLIMKMSTIRNM